MTIRATFDRVLLCLFLLTPTLNAQTKPAAQRQLGGIASYVGRIDLFTKNKRNRFRIFADVSSATANEKSRWMEFKTQAAMEAAGTGDNLNEQAFVWRDKGNVVCVKLTQTSPSGDWVQFVVYYFRADGSLAKLDAELNTFYGDVTVKRTRSFSETGRLLQSTTKYFDLKSQKPIKEPKDFYNKPVAVFTNVGRLPFSHLL